MLSTTAAGITPVPSRAGNEHENDGAFGANAVELPYEKTMYPAMPEVQLSARSSPRVAVTVSVFTLCCTTGERRTIGPGANNVVENDGTVSPAALMVSESPPCHGEGMPTNEEYLPLA